MAKKTLKIDGMSCTGCEQRVQEGLASLEGVRSADVDHETNRAQVRFVAGKEDEDAVREKIRTLGYEYVGMEDA